MSEQYKHFAALNHNEHIIGWITLEHPMTTGEGAALIKSHLGGVGLANCPTCNNDTLFESRVVSVEPAAIGP